MRGNGWRGRFFARAVLALAFALAWPVTAWADGPDTFGLGARNAALGGAMTAGSEDWAAAYYNPADVAEPTHTVAGVGFTMGVDNLQPFHDIVLGYDASGAPIRGDVGASYEPVEGLVGGLTVPLTHRLSLGAAFWFPAQRLIRIMTVDEFIPSYALYVNRAQRLHLDLCLAYRAPFGAQDLKVGVGMTTLATSIFNTDFQIPAGPGSDPNDSHAIINLDIVPALVPVAGVTYELGKGFRLGAGYRGVAEFRTDVTQASGAETVFQIGPSLRFRSSVSISGGFLYIDHYTPQEFSLGIKRERSDAAIALYFDASWINWSAYQGPYIDPDFNPIVVPPLGTVAVNWRHPLPVGFRDTVVPRVGAEWRISQVVALRGGYSYEMTPAPLATGESNVLDAGSHIVSAGLGFRFRDPLKYAKNPVKLNVQGRLRQLETTTSNKAVTYNCNDPTQHPPVGYPCSGSITAAGQVLSGGLDFDFDF